MRYNYFLKKAINKVSWNIFSALHYKLLIFKEVVIANHQTEVYFFLIEML